MQPAFILPLPRSGRCSDGRRNSRSPALERDCLFEPTSRQSHHFAFASWIPYHGAGYVTRKSAIGGLGPPDIEPYGFRSNMSPSLTLCYDMRKTDLNYRLAERLFTQLKCVQPNYLGDFYPLTPYTLANDAWLAWQYDQPETGSGVVQAFRRPDCGTAAMTFKLYGLNPDAQYDLENLDGGKETFSGRQLTEQGLMIRLDNQPSAAVISYCRKTETP